MNSIEEDIKILEVENYYLEELGYLRENNHFIKFNQALKNLIKAYKELKEENRIFALEGSRVRLKIHIDKNYIPVSLVEETIKRKKEYKLKYEQEFADNKDENYFFDINAMDKEIQVLEELLEKRK